MIVFVPGTVVSVLVLLLQSHRTTSQPPRSTTRLPGRSTTSRPTSSTTSQPSSSATSQPTSSPLSRPTSPTTSRLTSSTTSQPTSSKTSQPTSSKTSQPTSSKTSPPSSSKTSQPTSSRTSQPTSSATSQPTSSKTSQPTSSKTSQPTSSKTSQRTSSATSQPTSSKTSQPTSPTTSQSTSATTASQTSLAATRPANPTTPGPINPCQDCCNSVANLTAVIDQMALRLERQEQFLAETTMTIIGNISLQLERQERIFEETIRAAVGNISLQLEKQALALELVRQTIVNGSVIQSRNESQSIDVLLLENIATLLREQGDDLNQLRVLVADLNVQQRNFSQVLQTLADCGKEESELDKFQRRLIEEIHDVLLAPTDCMDIKATGRTVNGVYSVIVGQEARRREVNVSCDMRTTCGGWLVFQRRKDGLLNFKRKWSEYSSGFGDVNGEFWLGNDILHLLTSKRKYMLRIDLENSKGEKRFAQYSRFSVASALDYYRLTVDGYSGNAGDSLSLQNGQQFSTEDVDHDKWTTGNCAKRYGGAWWYNDCRSSSLNGSYADGKDWYHSKGFPYSLKATEMKIAPLD